MDEDLTGEANYIANEQGKMNAATAIITAVNEWSTRMLSAERRFIFELIQNSLDTATARCSMNFKVKISASDNKFVFSHNAGFFKMEELVALIFGGSSKPFDVETDFLGRFGTGFLVTHVLSKELSINGVLKRKNGDFYNFHISIDRKASDKGKMLASIENSFKQLNQASKIEDPKEFWTMFSYDIDPEKSKIIKKGIELLKTNMSAIFGFNRKISEITINDEVFCPNFSDGVSDISCIVPNLNQTLIIYPKEKKKLQIGLFFEEGKYSTKKRPPIYVGLPLADTQDFIELSFVMNSREFLPTKERDALTNNEHNKSLLSNSFQLFGEYVSSVASKLRSVEFFSQIFTFGNISKERMNDNEIWRFLNEIEHDTFKKLYTEVEAVKVKDSYLPIQNTIFPSDELNGKFMDSSQFSEFVNLLSHTNKKIPSGKEQENWIHMAEKMVRLLSESIQLYTIENLGSDMRFKDENGYTTISRVEEVMGWDGPELLLLNFFRISDNLYEQKLIHKNFVEGLIPNQHDNLGPLTGTFPNTNIEWELSIEDTENPIPVGLKNILEQIGRDVRSDLVHNNFSNFGIVKQLVTKVSNVELVLNSLLSKYYELPKKVEDFNGAKIKGWRELFVWCVCNKSLFKNFPLITKDGSVKQLEDTDKLSIMVPFDVLNVDNDYENLFPDSRILHYSYFENVGNFEKFLTKLEFYHAFVVRLINVNQNIQISSNRLKGISTNSEDKITSVSHRISTKEEEISSVPFINDVIGKIGESREQARMFLSFCVKILAKRDVKFSNSIHVTCDCGKDRTHEIYPSEWLASLKSDQWVPFLVKQMGDETTEKIDKYSPTRESIENLYFDEPSTLNSLMITNRKEIELLFPHLGYDRLDLAIKLRSLSSVESETSIRDRASRLFNVFKDDDVGRLIKIAEATPEVVSELIDQLTKKISDDNIREMNKIIGKNIEKILKKVIEESGVEVEPIFKGGDLVVWPRENEGFDVGTIEAGRVTIEIKFTVGARVHLSKLQSLKSIQNVDSYVVLVVHDQTNTLRNKLTEPLDISSISEDTVVETLRQCHVVEKIGNLLDGFPNSEEVEADLNGYWVKRKAWEDKESVHVWIHRIFSI